MAEQLDEQAKINYLIFFQVLYRHHPHFSSVFLALQSQRDLDA